jgi:hypothetical protein
MPDIKAVELTAELRQIKTMVDGTYSITLNLPEYMVKQVAVLLEWLGMEVTGVLSVKQEPNRKDGEIQTRSKWQS